MGKIMGIAADACAAASRTVGPVDADLFARLQEMGAGEFAHLDGSLADHLAGTEALLRDWGASEVLCRAGLCHAVYGTDGFNPALSSLDGRREIAALIGVDAEIIVYLYGACDRARFWPRIGTAEEGRFADRFIGTEVMINAAQLAALCELTIANELEIAQRSPAFRARHGAALSALFARMAGRASDAALRAARSVLE